MTRNASALSFKVQTVRGRTTVVFAIFAHLAFYIISLFIHRWITEKNQISGLKRKQIKCWKKMEMIGSKISMTYPMYLKTSRDVSIQGMHMALPPNKYWNPSFCLSFSFIWASIIKLPFGDLISNLLTNIHIILHANAIRPSSKIMKLLCDMTIKISKWSI